jgi:hypothetical protein
MNSALLTPRRACALPGMIIAMLCVLTASLHAQQGLSADEFYRQGDRISDRFANFMRGIFGSGAPNPVASMNPPPSQPAPSGYTQTPVYSNGSSSRGTSSRSTASSKTKRQSAPIPQASAPVATTKKSTKSTARTTTPRPAPADTRYTPARNDNGDQGGVYTSTKRSKDNVPASTTTGGSSPTVVKAPTSEPPATPRSGSGLTPVVKTPPANDPPAPPAGSGTISAPPSTPATVSTPPPPASSTTTKPATTPAPSSPPASQNFPVGTVGKKPGRVVSPYPPHNELDVRELPSGSLALDPTTQKIFRVP